MAKKPSNKKSNQSKGKGKGKSNSVKTKPKAALKAKATPKKPTKGKSTPKKINKGLNLYVHTRSVLWKHFGKDYKGTDYNTKGSEFLTVAGQVYRECRSANARGVECTDEIIIQNYNEIASGEQRFEPFVDDELYGQAQPYWEINSISWDSFEPYLWIISPMILPSPHEFQVSDYLGVDGDRSKGYSKYFSQWVDYNNEQEKLRQKGSSLVPHYVLTKPTYNKQKKRWEVYIYIISAGSEQSRTDENGVQLDDFQGWETDNYGFIPKGDIEEPKAPKKVTPPSVKKKKAAPKKKTPTKQKKVSPKAKKQEKKETESQRHKRVTNRTEELKEQANLLRESVKFYKEIGDTKEMKKELVDYKKIMTQIKNLK